MMGNRAFSPLVAGKGHGVISGLFGAAGEAWDVLIPASVTRRLTDFWA